MMGAAKAAILLNPLKVLFTQLFEERISFSLRLLPLTAFDFYNGLLHKGLGGSWLHGQKGSLQAGRMVRLFELAAQLRALRE